MQLFFTKFSLLSFFAISILFTSCNNEPSPEGIWKLSYEIKDGKKTQLVRNSRLLDFSQDSLKIIVFAMNTGTGYAQIDTLNTKYLRSGDVFTFHDKEEGDLEMNVVVSQDSIIWSHADTTVSKIKYIFKKIKPSSSKEVAEDDFIGKSFTIDNEFYHDSIHFMENNVSLQTGEYGFSSPYLSWDLVSYKGYDFLMLNTPTWGLIRLNISESGEIKLGDSPNAKNVLKMREAPRGLAKEELVGEWVELFDNRDQPQMPEPDFGERNSDVILKITSDSINVNYRNTDVIKAWDLTADGKRIYFKNQMFRSGELWWFQNGSWKIIDHSDSKIILHVYTGPMQGMGGDTVVLVKVNPPI